MKPMHSTYVLVGWLLVQVNQQNTWINACTQAMHVQPVLCPAVDLNMSDGITRESPEQTGR